MSWRFASTLGIVALCVTFAACTHKTSPNVAKRAPEPAAPAQTAQTPEPAKSFTQRAEAPSAAPQRPGPQRGAPPPEVIASIQELLNRIQDAYFDFDKHDIRSDAQRALQADANTLTDILKHYPDYKLTVQGFCDERGSAEYNIGLGDARAKKAKEYLVSLGIPGPQLLTISYGKERPVCTDQNEDCWQKNRRAHITQEQGTP